MPAAAPLLQRASRFLMCLAPLGLLLHLPAAHAAGFDCALARSAVEKLICSDAGLSGLDAKLNAAYEATSKAATADQKRNLTVEQRQWLTSERDKCTDLACLSNAYTKRIAELTGPMSVNAAQPSPLAVCDDIASLLRAAPLDDPWNVLTRGGHPFVETKGESETAALFDHAADDADVVNRFVSRFNPSDELRKVWVDMIGQSHVDVARLADSDLHVITETGGSADCYSFTFFRTPTGRPAQLLPPLPLKSDRDGENAICSRYGSDGYLARVGGIAGFLETYAQGDGPFQRDISFSYRFVPLRDGRWTNACAVDAAYQSRYRTSKAFAPAQSALTEAELRTLASRIVERRDAVKDAKDFSWGPPLSEQQKTETAKLADLIGKMDGEPVPTFGRDSELSAGEESLESDESESLPIVLNGHAYLLRLGTGKLGCCNFPGPILILYTLKDGKPEAAGSAFVEKDRGALVSASARPSR